MAGVNHLDVPAELAFVFNKLEGLCDFLNALNCLPLLKLRRYIRFVTHSDSQPVHNERQIVKVVGPVVEKKEMYELPSDVDQHVFSKFTNIYFKVRVCSQYMYLPRYLLPTDVNSTMNVCLICGPRRYFFVGKLPESNVLFIIGFQSHVWGMKREPIKTPFLHKTKDSDYADSLAIFKLILRFMNDDSLSDRKEQVLGDYICYKGVANEKLRDEILCQLVNQTWRNDVQANNEKGWLLMASCLSVFPPSPSLYKFLLKYVSDHGYNGYKSICQQKLLQSHNQWARSYPPCLLEWRANRKKVHTAVQVIGKYEYVALIDHRCGDDIGS